MGDVLPILRACELCRELIRPGQNELSEIWRDGSVSRYHLSCWDSVVQSDLLVTEDITLDFSERDTVDIPKPNAE